MIKSKLKNRNLSQEDVFNFSELFKLMKPRVMSLVIFTCAVGLLMAPNIIPTKDAIIGIILVSIGAGAVERYWIGAMLPCDMCGCGRLGCLVRIRLVPSVGCVAVSGGSERVGG